MALAALQQNFHLLRQGAALLRDLDPALYAGPGGVGPQFRHCLDFYLCFLRDLPEGRIDYDARQRQPRLETEPAAALECLEEIQSRLAGVVEMDAHHRLEVKTDTAPDEPPASWWSHSSLGRELRFLVSHTVHHYALISAGLRRHGVEPGTEFGMAPSTLAYREGKLSPSR